MSAWYEPVPPPERLRKLAACTWTARPHRVRRLVPDACLDLVCIGNGDLIVCGPETKSWTFALPSDAVAVGIRFLPGVLSATFHVDVSTIRNKRVPADQILGAARTEVLGAALSEWFGDDDLDGARRALEAECAQWRLTNDPLAREVTERLADDPSSGAAGLARALHMTPRQLHRRSCRLFGYGTAMLARILRFHRFTECASVNPSWRVAALAAESGYHDESHLVRDCRAIAGSTPRAFLDDWFPTFPPDRPLVPTLATLAGSASS